MCEFLPTIVVRATNTNYLHNLLQSSLIINRFHLSGGLGGGNFALHYNVSIVSKSEIFSFVAEYVKYFFETARIDIRSFNCSKLHVNETHILEQRFSAVAFVI